MTWANVNGVQVWNHKTFDIEPADDELAAYGWTRGNKQAPAAVPAKPKHTCIDCPRLIERSSLRCRECFNNHRYPNRKAATGDDVRPRHTCADCPTLILKKSVRCRPCHRAKVKADAAPRPERIRTKLDESVVERILAGDWRLHATKAERIAVTAVWLGVGNSQNALHRRTGWKVDRYVQRDDEQDVAA